MERELPDWALGVAGKRISWNRYLGDKDPVAVRAFEKYQKRVDAGARIISTSDEERRDWDEAAKEVLIEYATELMSQLA